MAFSTKQSYHAHIVSISGRFLGSVEKNPWNEMIAGLGQGPNVVIDLAKADFMDSSGVGLLIATAKTIREQGGDVVLANLTQRIKNLFAMMNLLGDVFTNYDSVEAAQQHFNTSAPA